MINGRFSKFAILGHAVNFQTFRLTHRVSAKFVLSLNQTDNSIKSIPSTRQQLKKSLISESHLPSWHTEIFIQFLITSQQHGAPVSSTRYTVKLFNSQRNHLLLKSGHRRILHPGSDVLRKLAKQLFYSDAMLLSSANCINIGKV